MQNEENTLDLCCGSITLPVLERICEIANKTGEVHLTSVGGHSSPIALAMALVSMVAEVEKQANLPGVASA